MRIKINGCPKYVRNKTVRAAAQFFAKNLFERSLNKKIKVDITFVPGLEVEEQILGDIGGCYGSKPTVFDIRIDKELPKSFLLKTLAHELTHAKQMAKGELIDLKNGKVRWYKKIYDPENIDRWDHPWEIEAHGREIGLYNKWYIWKYIQKK
jgi:hypothetical protein